MNGHAVHHDKVTCTDVGSAAELPPSSHKRRHSVGKFTYSSGRGYASPGTTFNDSSFRAEGALSKSVMNSDLQNISDEINELQRSIENLSSKGHTYL